VKGTRQRWIKSRSNIPNISLVKIGPNLTIKETLALENASFQLPQRTIMFPRRLFGGKVPFDMALYPTLACLDDHPNTRSGKNIQRNKKAHTTNHCIEGSPLTGQNDTSSGIWMHRYLGFGKPTQDSPYMITIGFFPNFSCPYFKEMVTKALSKRGHWVNCKHL
jgi:hypothetical protein